MMEEKKRLDDNGREVLDDTPVVIPARIKRQATLMDDVRRFVETHLSTRANAEGYESFDEADDFEVGDDYDPRSPHELDDGQLEYNLRNDPRYQRRIEEKERIALEGADKPKGKVRGGGKKPRKGDEGDTGGEPGSGGDSSE